MQIQLPAMHSFARAGPASALPPAHVQKSSYSRSLASGGDVSASAPPPSQHHVLSATPIAAQRPVSAAASRMAAARPQPQPLPAVATTSVASTSPPPLAPLASFAATITMPAVMPMSPAAQPEHTLPPPSLDVGPPTVYAITASIAESVPATSTSASSGDETAIPSPAESESPPPSPPPAATAAAHADEYAFLQHHQALLHQHQLHQLQHHELPPPPPPPRSSARPTSAPLPPPHSVAAVAASIARMRDSTASGNSVGAVPRTAHTRGFPQRQTLRETPLHVRLAEVRMQQVRAEKKKKKSDVYNSYSLKLFFRQESVDREGARGLAEATDRLRRSCRRLIWLNPLLRYDGFQPKSQGIRAMLPHVDDFRPVHNLASLRDLVATLSGPSPARRIAA